MWGVALTWDFTIYMYVRVPQKSQKDRVNFEELCNITPIAGLGLLYKDVWALVFNESVDLHYHLLNCDGQCPVLERVNNHIHYQNYTCLLYQYSSISRGRGGEGRGGGTYLRRGIYFKFWPIGGREYLTGGANSRIYSIPCSLEINIKLQ